MPAYFTVCSPIPLSRAEEVPHADARVEPRRDDLAAVGAPHRRAHLVRVRVAHRDEPRLLRLPHLDVAGGGGHEEELLAAELAASGLPNSDEITDLITRGGIRAAVEAAG